MPLERLTQNAHKLERFDLVYCVYVCLLLFVSCGKRTFQAGMKIRIAITWIARSFKLINCNIENIQTQNGSINRLIGMDKLSSEVYNNYLDKSRFFSNTSSNRCSLLLRIALHICSSNGISDKNDGKTVIDYCILCLERKCCPGSCTVLDKKSYWFESLI